MYIFSIKSLSPHPAFGSHQNGSPEESIHCNINNNNNNNNIYYNNINSIIIIYIIII